MRPLILMYHSVSRPASAIRLEPEIFAAQMDMLHASGRPVVPLADLVETRTEPPADRQAVAPRADLVEARADLVEAPGERPAAVALTFDDGFGDLATTVAPMLAARHWPATVFVCADRVGGRAVWEPDAASLPPLLDWPQLAELQEQGFEIASHGRRHTDLRSLDAAALRDEVEGSAERIGERLQAEPRLFAMPYGHTDARVRAAIARRYLAAVGTRLGVVQPDADRYDLPRIEMGYFRHPQRWRAFLQGGARSYFRLRQLGRHAGRWLRR